jgi:hypothetical protein
MTTTTQRSTVTEILAMGRVWAETMTLVPQSSAVDLLLDALNAAQRPAVRQAVLGALADFSHRRMSPSAEFLAALDHVQVVVDADGVFDGLVLEESAQD